MRQLEKASYLAEFLVQEDSRLQDLKGGTTTGTSTLARGLIGIIHVARKHVETMKTPPTVQTVNLVFDTDLEVPIHKGSRWEDRSIDFMEKDLRDTIQPHDNALVVTLRIGGFDFKRVMIDQGSRQR